jgi:hypothetical protein
MENKSFSGFTISPYCQDHPAVVGEILVSSGLIAIFTGLEPAGIRYLVRSADESPGTPNANLEALRPPIAVEYDWLPVEYNRKICHSFCRRQ